MEKNCLSLRQETCGVLVIGAGLAGITAAFQSADLGMDVMLCAKTRLCAGSSFYPLMDTLHCQGTLNPADEAVFLEDIRKAGHGMNDTYMNEYYVQNINDAIAYLKRLEIPFYKLPEPKLACFASHPHALYYWKNWEAIRSGLYEKTARTPAIRLRENRRLCFLAAKDGRAAGAVFYDGGQDEFVYVQAGSIILATGGFGALYKHNLNSADVAGDGHSAVLKAGGTLINLEFNQFIPGFIDPVYKVVFREGSLDSCLGLFSDAGENLLSGCLSPRKLKTCLKERALHGPFTFSDHSAPFDIVLMKEALRQKSGGVRIRYREEILADPRSYVKDYLRWLQDQLHVDLLKDEIRIAPFFHAANGGILVGRRCESTIKGVFACGECAGGIHGADRLGGNASGSCLVFGRLAAESAAAHARACRPLCLSESQVLKQFQSAFSHDGQGSEEDAAFGKASSPGQTDVTALTRQIQTLMWENAGILRTEESLESVLLQLAELRRCFHPWPLLTARPSAGEVCAVLEAETFLTLAPALLEAMLARKESRGSHYREDYPYTRPEFKKRLCVSQKDGGLRCVFESANKT